MPKELEVPNVEDNDNVASLLKIAIGHGTFENRDIGGKVFALLDSVADDIIHSGHTNSEITEELMGELAGLIKGESEELEGRMLEDDLDDADEVIDPNEDEDEDDVDPARIDIEDEDEESDDDKSLNNDDDDDDEIIPRTDDDDEESEEELLARLKKDAEAESGNSTSSE